MFTKLFLYVALAVVIAFLAFKSSVSFSYQDLKDYLSMLTAVSGMVFTIMGIWIAFIYPNALSRLVNPVKVAVADFSDTLDDTKRLEKIVAAVLQSAFVMLVSLLLILAKTFLYSWLASTPYLALAKASSAGIVITITLIQFEAVFWVIISNVMFINELHRKRQDRKSEELG